MRKPTRPRRSFRSTSRRPDCRWVDVVITGGGEAKPTGHGPVALDVVGWNSDSGRAVGGAEPGFRGAGTGGISKPLRRGEARESANESCGRGFGEPSWKPRVFETDEVLANDRHVTLSTKPCRQTRSGVRGSELQARTSLVLVTDASFRTLRRVTQTAPEFPPTSESLRVTLRRRAWP
jgi:hypothetical protein